jgi:AGZA family xanthine/uracil permease-like MFS transporter
MSPLVERLFKLKENGTTVRTEVIAGVVTFMTLSYIFVVQPTLLSKVGMDFGSVLTAVAISSAFATLLMAFLANYPIALAPAMGHNFFFAFTVCGAVAMGGLGWDWRIALGAKFISGLIFVVMAVSGIREMVVNAIPDCIKRAIAVGIGLLIAFLGLEWGGIVSPSPATFVTLGNLKHAVPIITLFGLLVIAVLMILRVRGGILIGMLVTTVIALAAGLVHYTGIVQMPPPITGTFLKLQPLAVFSKPMAEWLVVIFVLFFLDLFDNIGTLVGVCERAGFMKDGKIPRVGRALLTDSCATVVGTAVGTSTVTSYIESTAGVSEGGRTGLSNVVTAILMLLTMFFYPLVTMIGGAVTVGDAQFYPIIAPVLIVIGTLMMASVTKIPWSDLADAIPAFLTIVIMQFSFSITEGIAFGFISYALLKLLTGKGRQVHWFLYVAAFLLLLRYIFLRW